METKYNKTIDSSLLLDAHNEMKCRSYDCSIQFLLQIIVNVVLVNTIALFGIIGNSINVLVLRRHGIGKHSTNILLISLSISDLVYSAITIIKQIPFFVAFRDLALASRIFALFIVYSVYTIDELCISISVTITSAIAIERVVAVFFPFNVSSIYTPSRTKIIVMFIIFYVVCIASPTFYSLQEHRPFNPETNTTIYYYIATDWSISHGLEHYGSLVCNNLFSTANVIIVLLCSLAIVLKLACGLQTRRKLFSKTVSVDMRVHKIILLVCGICVLVFAPTTAIDMISTNSAEMSRMKEDLIILIQLLYGTNASINFVIYVAVSKKFYTTYKDFYRRYNICFR